MPYLVRQVMPPLRVPMQVSAEGELMHAVPRSAYTRFDTVEEATHAIGQTVLRRGRDDAEFEVLDCGEYEASLSAAEQRKRKLARAKKQAQREEDAA